MSKRRKQRHPPTDAHAFSRDMSRNDRGDKLYAARRYCVEFATHYSSSGAPIAREISKCGLSRAAAIAHAKKDRHLVGSTRVCPEGPTKLNDSRCSKWRHSTSLKSRSLFAEYSAPKKGVRGVGRAKRKRAR